MLDSTRNHRRSLPAASQPEEWQRLTACSRHDWRLEVASAGRKARTCCALMASHTITVGSRSGGPQTDVELDVGTKSDPFDHTKTTRKVH